MEIYKTILQNKNQLSRRLVFRFWWRDGENENRPSMCTSTGVVFVPCWHIARRL